MDTKKPLILSVDDNPVNNKLVSSQLKYKGLDIISATSGEEALKMIAEHHPDVVLLDIMMPEMDGFQVLEAIRENPETEELPVIMVSALADMEHHVEATMKGANGYLNKPLLLNILLDELQKYVQL